MPAIPSLQRRGPAAKPRRRPLWKTTKPWLYRLHRWLGIGACLLFVMWFASGVVMMYVPFPSQSEADRRRALAPIAWEHVAITPAQAMALAGTGAPRDSVLHMRAEAPVYRITDATGALHLVSAVDGRPVPSMTADEAVALVRSRWGAPDARLIQTLERDQWTVPQGYNPHRPLHRVAQGDGAGTEIYVSSRTGEVVLETTASQRFWNWLGAVPHWLYFTPLRQNGPLWSNVVLWIAGPCIAVAVTGVWIGLLRLRPGKTRYRGGRISPYGGWMLWHHISGVLGGVAVITFIFSGWMSMNPLNLFSRAPVSQTALAAFRGDDGRPFPGHPAAGAQDIPADVVEARFSWLGGQPLVQFADAASHGWLRNAAGREVVLSDQTIAEAAARLFPGTELAQVTRLREADAYWYSHHRIRPLPVVRVAFADARRTFVHIDPATGDIVGTSTSALRLYRWLYNGLHSLDFTILLHRRPLWDMVMGVLSLLGLVISVSGVVIGWRRLLAR
ncbi:PepSY domain-containing protein [Azorhizobium sp. AG788]|uniref:PepSY domain-containing protein n=1 Tax=Azorhizobium sp. AG788 TaxID=2183897 RepID=UPI0031389C1F